MSSLRFLPLFCFAALPAFADPASEMRALGNCAECEVRDGDFAEARLMGIDLSDASIRDTDFSGANMNIAVLNGAELEGVRFDGTDLSGSTFVNARLTSVSFEGADLTGAVFEGAVLIDTDLTAGLRCNTQMPDDEIDNAQCDRD